MIKAEIIDALMPITDEERAILKGQGIDRSLYMGAPGRTISGEKLLSAGKLIAVRKHTRFVHFPEHTHDFVEMVYMVSGVTTHIVNGQKILLKEGEILILSQNAVQEILPAEKNDIAVNFIILPQFFGTSLEMMGEQETPLREFIVDCLTGTGENSGFLHFEVSDILPVQNLVENLIWTLINDTPNKRNINQITMGLLFLQLLNCTERISYSEKSETAALRVLRYIEGNYRDGSLAEASALFHYDFCWLSREIKKKTGKTYTQLVQGKRLAQAAFYLKNTKMRISDISRAVGYDNVSYFHRLFFDEYKQSPKHYRDCK